MGTVIDQAPAQPRWIRDIGTAPSAYHQADHPALPPAWWRANRRYTLYMARELSSLSNALWSVSFLLQLNQLRRGPAAYDAAVAARRRPLWLALHAGTLGFAFIHSITFLLAAGKGPTVRVGGRRVPERAIATGAFVSWAAGSLAVLLILLFGGRGERSGSKGDAA